MMFFVQHTHNRFCSLLLAMLVGLNLIIHLACRSAMDNYLTPLEHVATGDSLEEARDVQQRTAVACSMNVRRHAGHRNDTRGEGGRLRVMCSLTTCTDDANMTACQSSHDGLHRFPMMRRFQPR